MATKYACELCKKVFNQKIDFTRHQNKKAPCITLTEIQQINQIKEVKTDNKSILINTFKNCLNIMRDNEGLTGEKALRNLSYLLIVRWKDIDNAMVSHHYYRYQGQLKILAHLFCASCLSCFDAHYANGASALTI